MCDSIWVFVARDLQSQLTITNTVKALVKRHLTQDTKRDHLEPADNADFSQISLAHSANFGNEVIPAALHNIFLNCECFCGGRNDEGLFF